MLRKNKFNIGDTVKIKKKKLFFKVHGIRGGVDDNYYWIVSRLKIIKAKKNGQVDMGAQTTWYSYPEKDLILVRRSNKKAED
jgi:hypothetical protein